MGARGKKSAAALEAVPKNPVCAIERPAPLPELTKEQALEWVTVTNSLKAEWFPPETHSMLAQYCRHVVSARRVSEMIDSLLRGEAESEDWVGDYDKLLKMQEREGRAISSLATRMRLTQQATYAKDKGKGAGLQRPPHIM